MKSIAAQRGMTPIQAAAALAVENARFTHEYVPLPIPAGAPQLAAWRNRWFLAQLYAEPGGWTRLSINRTTLDRNGRWVDGTTWDELMSVKRGCGFADVRAIEIYPEDDQVVDVANIRHLWMHPTLADIGWNRKASEVQP